MTAILALATVYVLASLPTALLLSRVLAVSSAAVSEEAS